MLCKGTVVSTVTWIWHWGSRYLSAEMSVHLSLWKETLCPCGYHDCGGLHFGKMVLLKYPPPVVPPQEAFMKLVEACYHVPGQFSMKVWVCNRNKFLWCKKDLIMSLFTNGFGVHFLVTWDLIEQVAILEDSNTFEKNK